jgi:glutaredoxin 3
MQLRLKTAFTYAFFLIIATGIGLGAGFVAANWADLTSKKYVEGDFSIHFPDRTTQVVLYGTLDCPYCIKARAYFASKKIKYHEIILNSENEKKVENAFELLKTEGSVPAIIIGNRMIVGFKPSVIEDALKNAQIELGRY